MFFILLLLFIAVPFVELSLLFAIGGQIGALRTFAIIILTGIIGASLAKWQGARTWMSIREELQAHRLPGDSLIDAGMILVAGALLLTPGILTDALGFSLLIPPARAVYRRLLKRWFKSRFKLETVVSSTGFTGPGFGFGEQREVIHGEAVDPDEA
ncbi:MAG: FxsA family protein [Planctomycetales bacterium]|nr:FxsA family protein [Planctomycetales bacterium]